MGESSSAERNSFLLYKRHVTTAKLFSYNIVWVFMYLCKIMLSFEPLFNDFVVPNR